jgi:serine/threonine-protein kinase
VNIAPEIGSIVADKFRIERVLAEGGMGLVVAATHIQLEQTVALKFFRGDLRSSGEPLLRFMREAKAAAQIKSEYVARVLDVGVTDDGTPYMVMEYLEGEGLEKVVARGPMPVPSAVEYAIQACEGLAEAHARGIVHRDIKPSNLFLTERSPGWRTIKILDFGISKVSLAQASNITTNLNLVMGTPCYMSPEQFQSAAGVDQRSDIWSLGSTLFEMLAGRPPFDPGLPLLALAESIVKREPPPLRELRPDVPQDLVDAISRAMAKDRERRFPSAAGLAIALLPFAPGRASAPAERAAAITPARGLRELDQQELHTLPPLGAAPAKENTDGKSGMWTHLGFASPAPPPRENAATPPPPAPSIAGPAGTPASLITGGVPVAALVPVDRAPVDEVEAPGPWQPKTSWVVITAGVLVCAVAVLAFLRTSPSPRASASALTISQAPAPVAPAPGASSSTSSELLVRVTPATAQIMIDGALVSGNPFRGRFPGGAHQIQAFAPGYEPKLQQASLATDVVVELSLDRRTRGAPPVTAGRATPPPAQARMPPLGQGARLQQPRPPSTPARVAGGSAAGAPTTTPPAPRPAIPGLVTPPDVVDPRGGRNPMHPIEIRSPYKNSP